MFGFNRNGYVYLLQSSNGLYKIGRAKDVDKRLKSLTKSPVKITLLHTIKSTDMVALESSLHTFFADKRVEGEWFRLTHDDVEWIRNGATYKEIPKTTGTIEVSIKIDANLYKRYQWYLASWINNADEIPKEAKNIHTDINEALNDWISFLDELMETTPGELTTGEWTMNHMVELAVMGEKKPKVSNA